MPTAARATSSFVVEQQHGARVDVERLARALEQLGEQRLEIEVRERRVGDKLEAAESLRLGVEAFHSGTVAPVRKW